MIASFGSLRDRTEPVSLYVQRRPSVMEVRQNDTGAKFEPPWGCYLGAYIDRDETLERAYRDEVNRIHRLPEDFEAAVGKAHATYFFYMGYGVDLATEWVRKLGLQNKIVHIALEPNLGLGQVHDDGYLRKLAESLASTNAKVFLRFASEMNGNWVAYSKSPELYKAKFRLVARVMHEAAPNVAMVWCPYSSPTNTIGDFYPGDDVVDWVGVNMYSVTYYDQDPRQPAWMVDPCDMLDFVYDSYSRRKPVMVAEYGATHFSAVENESKTDYAVRCLKSLYQALPRRYPRVKAIDYFDANNLKPQYGGNNDYSLTSDNGVKSAYSRLTAPAYFLSAPADKDSATPDSPMPLLDDTALRGKVLVSAWVMCRGEGCKVRYLLDGTPVWSSPNNGDWEAQLDFSMVPAGVHNLTVEAYAGVRWVGAKSVRVTVAP